MYFDFMSPLKYPRRVILVVYGTNDGSIFWVWVPYSNSNSNLLVEFPLRLWMWLVTT